jgi:hypothetical protein
VSATGDLNASVGTGQASGLQELAHRVPSCFVRTKNEGLLGLLTTGVIKRQPERDSRSGPRWPVSASRSLCP